MELAAADGSRIGQRLTTYKHKFTQVQCEMRALRRIYACQMRAQSSHGMSAQSCPSEDKKNAIPIGHATVICSALRATQLALALRTSGNRKRNNCDSPRMEKPSGVMGIAARESLTGFCVARCKFQKVLQEVPTNFHK